jgi:hypothetical protein
VALSIPLAAVAVLLLRCVKVTDTLASRRDRRWHDVGGSLALEKTGAARALTRALVIHLQWAGGEDRLPRATTEAACPQK